MLFETHDNLSSPKIEDIDEYISLLDKDGLALSFPERLERRYQYHVTDMFSQVNLYIMAFGIFLYLSFFLVDVVLYPEYLDFLIPVRFVSCLFLLSMFVLYHKRVDFFTDSSILIAVSFVICTIHIVLAMMYLPAPLDLMYGTGLILIFLYCIAMLRFNFMLAAYLCVFFVVSVGLTLLKVYESGHENLEVASMIDVTVHVVFLFTVLLATFAFYFVYSIEWLTRKNWLQMQILGLESEQLHNLGNDMRELSITDGLTGLKNRRHFDKELSQLWRYCSVAKTPLSLIIFDVDWFKKYNDYYGHPQGDSCLKQISDVVTNMTKDTNYIACRYGGEEFCVLLPFVDLEDAAIFAEKIRLSIKQLHIEHLPSPKKHCTVSIGVGSITPVQSDEGAKKSKEIASFITTVDTRLYQAKIDGKDRFVAADTAQISQ